MDPSIYLLHPGTSVYKGDTELYMNGVGEGDLPFAADPSRPVYLAMDSEAAKEYGVVLEFVVRGTEPLALVNLSDPGTMSAIYRGADLAVQDILVHNFGYQGDKARPGAGVRNSVHARDSALATYLCHQGYNGYALTTAPATDFGGHFHPEMGICRGQDRLEFVRVMSDEEEIRRQQEKRIQKSIGVKRKPRRSSLSPSAAPGPDGAATGGPMALFMDEDEEMDAPNAAAVYGTPPKSARSLFGGKRRQGRKTHKSRKGRKTCKTHKSRKGRKTCKTCKARKNGKK
jgi:hypothetical protein